MIEQQNRRVFIQRHGDGTPALADFGIGEETIEGVAAGEVLVRVDTLSVDAWILTTLSAPGMHETGRLGSTVQAFGVGQVLVSNSPQFVAGDWVYGMLAAQTHAVLPASQLTKVVPEPQVDPRAYIGPLGITTGLTAWVGLVAVGEAQAGEVVLVSGAAGAVGSCVVQLAKARGARVIGIAGGPEKCAYLSEVIGADATIDYKQDDVASRIAELAPDGIDVFFDNVGGEILDSALDNLRPTGGARVLICGAISQYRHLDDVRGPKLYLRLAERNASMRGFVVSHHAARFPEAVAEISELIRSGKLKLPEHVVTPIDNFPEALLMLLDGKHTGNLVVRP
ncbi:NADP-dependent oxidoreductase [Novosphingobium sp. Gsoil 351]|uniref:NADP-dependent oxidoreductase n=1 Tax=Novosphingobium sp. Gsoil 351 TaxID=2675225 RepID=UPI0018A85AA0|nr:NADP-dependent oxidoreductase [Novosphingobium sp. Gsoil 351]